MTNENAQRPETIVAVAPHSIAAALEIRPGDVLRSVNGRPVRDVLDVQFYAADLELELVIWRDGQSVRLHTLRDDRPLGLDFAAPVFDGMRLCRNHCEFCFVTQMPPRRLGLRSSLYLRDDDYRYSVLYGSFITLTNLTADDWQRIREQRLGPLYISVHATEPALRQQLLGRPDIPTILPQIDQLAAWGIEMHTQLVLTPGLNDGEHLERSVADLAARYPAVQSIGVVPVGLTRYHRGDCRPYTAAQAREVIAQIEPRQQRYREQHGSSLVYLADEWYLLTDAPIPPETAYDGYPQIENGIGLTRQFLQDCAALRLPRDRLPGCTLACGALIAPLLQQEAQRISEQIGVQFEVVTVINQLFGETVTVSGLLGGEDVAAALQDRPLNEVICLPHAMFDAAGERTLDDWTRPDFERLWRRPVILAERMSQILSQLAHLHSPRKRGLKRSS